MTGYTEFSIKVDLPFEHCCEDCNNFTSCKNEERDATWREILKDWFSWNKDVRWKRLISSITNYCSEKNKQVDPEAKEPCFVWTGSHEAWMPYIKATIIDGKVKVVFE